MEAGGAPWFGHGDELRLTGSGADELRAEMSVLEKLRGAVGESWACCPERIRS